MNKKKTLVDFVFPKLRTPKTWWDKRLKCPVSEDPSPSNMLNVPKHCWNLHQCTFVLLIDYWKLNLVGNSLLYWHAKSWDCLLTLWLPMKCILFLRETIQMQLSHKQKPFSAFLASILKSRLHFENFDQNDTLIDFVILKLRTAKS